MASTNQSPQYQKAEAMFLNARTDEDKLYWLNEMIRECPKHKSAEKMLAQLRIRRKKLLEKIERTEKRRKSVRHGIRKEEMQAVIVGFTNTGKSSLLSILTNAAPEISPYNFTTKNPIVGMMPFSGTQIQIIEIPAIESGFYDKSLVNNADAILLLVNSISEIEKILTNLDQTRGDKLIVFNNKNNLDERKLESTLKSKKYNFIIINTESKDGFEKLKEKIFLCFHKIRVYTKEPGKEKSKKPIILDQNSTVYDVAEKIKHGFSSLVKEAFVTGPSSKFPNQKVSLKHILKDMDVVEFRVR